MSDFAARLVTWQKRQGRHDLPWQNTRDPYRIWLSEIMLQQTQVGTVVPYYLRFLERFPNIPALAGASEDEVLTLWSGLGYYSRARNLHRGARMMVERHGGQFPEHFEDILALPGVGRSTAAAVSVFAFGARCAILDGNVKRVLTRYFGIEGFPGDKRVENALWERAEALLPVADLESYTQGLMDLGATLCTRGRPRCQACPMAGDCFARGVGRVRDFPAPRPARAIPLKQTAMLILMRQGEVLLEKRPPAGIWGGLWSLPEMEMGGDAESVSRERFGAEIEALAPLPVLSHGFTHFKLEILPLPARVQRLETSAGEAKHVWLPFQDALRAALPTPVRKLLLQAAELA